MSSKVYVDLFAQSHPSIDLSSYFEFIEKSRLDTEIKSKTAKHHILPRWAFPDYKSLSKHSWNKAILTHEDHLMAHFLLWRCWRVGPNATPLLLMCRDFNLDALTHESIQSISALYSDACLAHATRVSERHTGKVVSEETRRKSSEARKRNPDIRGRINVLLKETREPINITTEEYYTNRGLYLHYCEGKTSHGLGLPNIKRRGRYYAFLTGTRTMVELTTEEYQRNKHLYDAFGKGNKHGLDAVAVESIETGERYRVTREEYANNQHLYKFHTSDTVWYNNGTDQLRLPSDADVPEGYIRGRLKRTTKAKHRERTCPHCGLVGKGGNMVRFHFDNCKKKPQ